MVPEFDWIDAAPVVSEWRPDEAPTAEEERWARAALSSAWQQRFSVALQRGNAVIIIGRSRALRDRMGIRVRSLPRGGDMDYGAAGVEGP